MREEKKGRDSARDKKERNINAKKKFSQQLQDKCLFLVPGAISTTMKTNTHWALQGARWPQNLCIFEQYTRAYVRVFYTHHIPTKAFLCKKSPHTADYILNDQKEEKVEPHGIRLSFVLSDGPYICPDLLTGQTENLFVLCLLLLISSS